MEGIRKDISDTNTRMNSDISQLNYDSPIIEDALKKGPQGDYLGKNINFQGTIFHLSNKGALKLYPNSSILSSSMGRNGCPAEIIDIPINPYDSSFREQNPYVFNGTPMTSTGDGYEMMGQSCGNGGANVYVEEKPAVLTQYRGCANAEELKMEDIGNGGLYTYDQCKELAGMSGYTSFSVNTSQVWNQASNWINDNQSKVKNFLGQVVSSGAVSENSLTADGAFKLLEEVIDDYKSSGVCYASKAPMEANDTIIYNASAPYTIKSVIMPLVNYSFIDSNYEQSIKDSQNLTGIGVYIEIFTSEILLKKKDTGELLASWMVVPPNSKCSNGGGVNLKTLSATYGANCATQCTIGKGNYTQNALKNINGNQPTTDVLDFWNTNNPSFVVGSTWINFEGRGNPNNTIGPEDNFDPCVGCGKEYSITYQCGENTESNTINVPAEAFGQSVSLDCNGTFWDCIWGIAINDLGEIKVLQNFWGSGNTLEITSSMSVPSFNDQYSGKLVPNPDILQNEMWKQVVDRQIITTIQYNNQTYNVFISGYHGMYPGEILVSPSGTCYMEIGSNGYLMMNYFVESTTCNSNTGNYIGVVNVPGTYIGGQQAPNQYAVNEIVTKPFLQNFGKKGYVDDNLVLHEYPQSMLPTYNEMSNVYAGENSKKINTETATSAKQCMIKCGGNNDCNFFEFNGNQCNYYNIVGNTGVSSGTTFYSKVGPSETNDNCPFMNTSKISTSDWEYYVKGEMMTPSTNCFVKNDSYLNNEIDNLKTTTDNTQNELANQIDQTNTYLNNWNNLSTSFEERIAQNKTLADNINAMKGREGFTTGTTQMMFNESVEIQHRNRYRNIFWTLLAITLIIMVLRLIQLYSK